MNTEKDNNSIPMIRYNVINSHGRQATNDAQLQSFEASTRFKLQARNFETISLDSPFVLRIKRQSNRELFMYIAKIRNRHVYHQCRTGED